MKYDAQRSFGYPVLRGNLDDYVKGSFQPSISPQRKVSGDAKKMAKDVLGAVEKAPQPVARTDYAENEAPF